MTTVCFSKSAPFLSTPMSKVVKRSLKTNETLSSGVMYVRAVCVNSARFADHVDIAGQGNCGDAPLRFWQWFTFCPFVVGRVVAVDGGDGL